MNTSNIVLIGMPGAGKSTIGVLLAKSLKKPFIDTDLLIQQQEDRFLQEIINKEGIDKFLSIEKKVILTLNAQNCVIATGGSAIYSNSSINHLKANGVLVYLKLPYKEIEERIKDIKSRGIAMGQHQNLFDLFTERVHLYEKYADITVDCSGICLEDTVVKIKDIIEA